jgi:hypothetical protein
LTGRYYEPLCALAKERGALSLRNLIDTVIRVNSDLSSEKDLNEAVAAVNAAVRGGDVATTHAAIQHAALGIGDVRDTVTSEHYTTNCPERYHASLATKCTDSDVTRDVIAEVVAGVNTEVDSELAVANALGATNAAVTANDVDATIAALFQPVLALNDVDEAGADQYLAALTEALDQSSDPSLTVDEIQACITQTNFQAEEAAKVAASLFRVNETITKSDAVATCTALAESYAKVENVQEKCTERYKPVLFSLPYLATTLSYKSTAFAPTYCRFCYHLLLAQVSPGPQGCADRKGRHRSLLRVEERQDRGRSGLLLQPHIKGRFLLIFCRVVCCLSTRWGGLNIRLTPLFTRAQKETQWVVPAGPELEKQSLNADEIRTVVAKCNDEQARAEFLDANMDKIVLAQSVVRGHQARKAYTDRKGCVAFTYSLPFVPTISLSAKRTLTCAVIATSGTSRVKAHISFGSSRSFV